MCCNRLSGGPAEPNLSATHVELVTPDKEIYVYDKTHMRRINSIHNDRHCTYGGVPKPINKIKKIELIKFNNFSIQKSSKTFFLIFIKHFGFFFFNGMSLVSYPADKRIAFILNYFRILF